MRAVLVSYFDLGLSFGLRDTAFREESLAAPNIGIVGLDPPIGRGVIADVLRDERPVLDRWREEACRQVFRDVMELGPHTNEEGFRPALEEIVRTHDVDRCTLTVYAIGTVYVELWFAPGVPDRFVRGLTKCFEFAGYRPDVADGLHEAALRRAQQCLSDPALAASPLTELTRRGLPPVTVDPEETGQDGKPYAERLLMPAFTTLLVCTEADDRQRLRGVLTDLEPLVRMDSRPVIDFEYHGRITFGWATSAIEARVIVRPESPGEDDADEQILRMLACVQVANVLLATCTAFERLFLGEIDEQVGGYLSRTRGGRVPEDLNRLRNLALAVVSLTESTLVTQTEEDRRFFEEFEKVANTDKKRQFTSAAADMVYNVSDAETQAANTRRDILLNGIVLLLTSLTVLSVSADLYDFVRDQAPLVRDRPDRVRLVIEFVLALTLVLVVVWYALSRPHRGRRGGITSRFR